MEIIVNDTNIFIDLHSIGLLSAFCELPYDVRTVDFVVNEIRDQAQAESFAQLAGKGKIKIENFDLKSSPISHNMQVIFERSFSTL